MAVAYPALVIIDDEPDVAFHYRKQLNDLGFSDVRTAHNAIKALQSLQEARADLVFMDIRMPVDGVQLAQVIRDLYDIPSIYLTAHSDPETIALVQSHGLVHGYLLKAAGETADLKIEIGRVLHNDTVSKKEQTTLSFSCDRNASVTSCSLAMSKVVFGRTLSQIIGCHLAQCLSAEGSRDVLDCVARVLNGTNRTSYLLRVNDKELSELPIVEVIASPILLQDMVVGVRHVVSGFQSPTQKSFAFDVFVNYATGDKPASIRVANALRQRGIKVWLPEWELRPGIRWQDVLDDIIQSCGAAVLCFGSGGLGVWELHEIDLLVTNFAKRTKAAPIIPLLLPGASNDLELPPVLKEHSLVDLRKGLKKDGLDRLEWGITGEKVIQEATATQTERLLNDECASSIAGAVLERQSCAEVHAITKLITIDEVKGNVDFAIITIREDEFEAVLDRFGPRQSIAGGKQMYELCRFVSIVGIEFAITIVRSFGQGQNAAQSVARDVIEDLDPGWLILAGIAGAAPANECSLGDVCLASRLNDFSVSAAIEGKLPQYQQTGGPMHREIERLLAWLPAMRDRLGDWNCEDSIRRRKPHVQVPKSANSRFLYGPRSLRQSMLDSLARHFPPGGQVRPPRFHIGPGATAGVLMKDTELLSKWQESARHLTHVEMEAGGVYEAARHGGNREYPLLCVRGISDVVGLRRHPDWTEFACHSAAAFVYALLKHAPICPR